MRTDEKLVIALRVIAKVAPQVREQDERLPAGPSSPANWSFETDGLRIIYTEHVLLYPEDDDVSNLIDIWPNGARKVFSASWKPARPWLPPRVLVCRAGDWLKGLGVLGG